jgi:hypothetical protein
MLLRLGKEWGKETPAPIRDILLSLVRDDIPRFPLLPINLDRLRQLFQLILCLPRVCVVMGIVTSATQLLIRASLIQTVKALTAYRIASLSWLISPAIGTVLCLRDHGIDVEFVLACSRALPFVTDLSLDTTAIIIVAHILYNWICRRLTRHNDAPTSFIFQNALPLLTYRLLSMLLLMVVIRNNNPCFAPNYAFIVNRLTS